MSSPLLDAYKKGEYEHNIASECYEYGYNHGKKEIINEIHKVYSNQKFTDEEVLEQIKLILNREVIKDA